MLSRKNSKINTTTLELEHFILEVTKANRTVIFNRAADFANPNDLSADLANQRHLSLYYNFSL